MTSVYKCRQAGCRHNSIWIDGEPAYRCQLNEVSLDEYGGCQEFKPEETAA